VAGLVVEVDLVVEVWGGKGICFFFVVGFFHNYIIKLIKFIEFI
jgi:hypothetical protein